MDMTLEERIAASNNGRRGPGRRDGGGGVRKNRSNVRRGAGGGQRNRSTKGPSSFESSFNDPEDAPWTHDRYAGDDDYDPRGRRSQGNTAPTTDRGSKVYITNLHPDVSENDLKAVFSEPGGLRIAKIIWERDRSSGTAFAIYDSYEQADCAVHDFDGQLAKGQPITVKHDVRSRREYTAPSRSLEDRITLPNRSESPISRRSATSRPAPAHIDRYVPPAGRGSVRRQEDRGPRREPRGGRESRESREGREGRGGRANRPRKTREELDAEMDEYMGNAEESAAAAPEAEQSVNATQQAATDEDVDMLI
ncbi:hypothetical protein GQ43DRAFT_474966 [Delitschia confertaspora ATCC 74209]|uniref:RRM domain-containing protein n=1 Tax=Delitschia confertaspora ATCC 74209 TaxID=1513339 RepID=A0A9P4JHB6_9PLEO|nr:hypothetical protein GQ43DRAFT_474966 [Delitschia confertaspora ATCC 74209]